MTDYASLRTVLLCTLLALAGPAAALAGDPPAGGDAPAADSRVVVGTHRDPPPPRPDEPLHLRVYPGLQAPAPAVAGPPAGGAPAPTRAPAAAAGTAPPPTPAPGTPGGIPLGIDVGMSLATCPDGRREISALDLGGWAMALQPVCVDRALQGRLTVHRPAPRGANAPAPAAPVPCDPGRWTCTTTR
jgi:hypothetical protein